MIRFEYPPKPMLISKDQPLFQNLSNDSGVVAELKYNGTRIVLLSFADGRFEFWERHKHILKYQPSMELIDQLRSLKWKGDCVLDCELLHFKTDNIKHTLVVFDVFYWDGNSLKNMAFENRRQILESLFYANVFPNVYPAPQFETNFPELFEEVIKRKEIEGLVMKKLDAKLEFGFRDSPVVKYMWKVRKPDGKYKF